MALTKESFNELFISRDGLISVRTTTVVLEDGIVLAQSYHRKVLAPGDDVTKETDTRIQAVATAVWTKDVIDLYEANKAARELKYGK